MGRNALSLRCDVPDIMHDTVSKGLLQGIGASPTSVRVHGQVSGSVEALEKAISTDECSLSVCLCCLVYLSSTLYSIFHASTRTISALKRNRVIEYTASRQFLKVVDGEWWQGG